jgi:hypothetical protein
LIFLFLLSYSCDYIKLKGNSVEKEAIASVGGVYLYKSDLKGLYNKDLSVHDSLIIVNNFIESWARKQIIIQKATLNLSKEKEEELKVLIDDYKKDLYINTYKDALVSQNLDTLITDKSIADFYKSNQTIFKLKEAILKYKYVSYNKKLYDSKKIKELFLKDDIKELDSLVYNEYKFSSSQLNDSIWFSYESFMGQNIYLKGLNKEKVLKKNYFNESVDVETINYFKVVDVKHQGEVAPLQNVKPVIKQMLLHKKKLEFIKELDNKLIEEAINNNTFKRY